MKILANWFNYPMEGNPSGETFTLPSETIPGQVLSLEKLLQRLVRGEQVQQFNATYQDDPDVPDVLGMDEQDKLMLAREYKELGDTKKQILEQRRYEREARQAAAEIEHKPDPEASQM